MNPEAYDAITRFVAALHGPLNDGQRKRYKGEKPPWYEDEHLPALLRHLERYLAGERVDADSGAHPMDHIAARALMISCKERGDVPRGEGAAAAAQPEAA